MQVSECTIRDHLHTRLVNEPFDKPGSTVTQYCWRPILSWKKKKKKKDNRLV